MVARSIDDWEQHKKDVEAKINFLVPDLPPAYMAQFMQRYNERYNPLGRSYLSYKLAFSLFDDYKFCEKIGTKFYGIIGSGGTGKTTLGENVMHFLDSTFDLKREHMDYGSFTDNMLEFPRVDAMKGIIMDEPDDEVHPSSKQGRIMKSIFGKARQQKLFIAFCATDLMDIPSYYYRKMNGLFWVQRWGRAYYFKDEPNHDTYILSEIKQRYPDEHYNVFFDIMKTHKRYIQFDTMASSPFSHQKAEYLAYKQDDYDKTIRKLRGSNEPKEGEITPTMRAQLLPRVMDMKATNEEKSKLLGISESMFYKIASKERSRATSIGKSSNSTVEHTIYDGEGAEQMGHAIPKDDVDLFMEGP